MKRCVTWCLILSLALAGIVPAALAEGEPGLAENTLAVGTITPMSGGFFTDMWGNNSSDMDVRAMLHGYATVAWVKDGDFVIDDTTVKEVGVVDDSSGNRTYTFALNDQLQYNDGTPILARDYVFAVLLRSCPQIAALGGMNQAFNHLMGFEAFAKGEPFTGVRLLEERKFSLTIKRTSLPYFYEMQMVNVEPVPMDIIAPGFDVLDTGKGAEIVPLGGEGTQTLEPELLAQTLLDPETGYQSHPKRTCGPYQLQSYDAAKQEVVFTRNPNYLGNYEGQKPEIEHVSFLTVKPETMFDDLSSGRIGLLNKVTDGVGINQGMQMSGDGQCASQNYPRAGLNMLAFACELGATQSNSVRQAIAMTIDEQELCAQHLQGYGIPVYGYYGLGQWMSQEWMKNDSDSLMELCLYSADQYEAAKLLEDDGWIYNESGELYDAGKGGVRYRKQGKGELEPLVLRCALPENGTLTPYVKEKLTENLAAIGADIQCDELAFADLLRQYYRQTERTYHIMLLATNFHYVFDPYYTFSDEDLYQGVHNTTGIRDAKLMKLTEAMRRVTPGDREAYLAKWMDFQKYWVQELPMAPLYSNVYFDFFRADLQNYLINASNTWAAALLYSYLGEPREPAPTAEPEVPADGEETVTFE